MKICNLENCFKAAMENGSKYIGIRVNIEGSSEDEIIINPRANFQRKLEYYKEAYNTDLQLKHNNAISIKGFTYGNSFSEIENDLL